MLLKESKTVLNPESIPHVEIDFMNNTHFEEIKMVKELGKLITDYEESNSFLTTGEENNKEEAITQSLQNWLNHTVAHFEKENELMRETQFPAYPIHSNEHEIALDKMKTILKAWEANQDIELVADYVFTLWPTWFNGHVNSMDMMTAKFAAMNGFNPKM